MTDEANKEKILARPAEHSKAGTVEDSQGLANRVYKSLSCLAAVTPLINKYRPLPFPFSFATGAQDRNAIRSKGAEHCEAEREKRSPLAIRSI